MRLDSILDLSYFLGSAWGVVPGVPVCMPTLHAPSKVEREETWSPVPKTRADVTAFVEVNVVPMDAERVLASQTVLVESGQITAVGPASQVKIPDGAVRIDGRGKYLMPGFSDLHTHVNAIYLDRMLVLANGVLGVRDISKQLEERAPGPHAYLTGSAPSFRYPPRPESVATHIASAKAAGVEILKLDAAYVRDTLSREQREVFDSIMAATRRLGLPVSVHGHSYSFEQVLALGAGGGAIEHIYAFQVKPHTSSAELRAQAMAIQRAGTWVTLTLNCHDRSWNGAYASWNKPHARQLAKALQDAGVGLLLGADADSDFRKSPSMVHSELAAFVRAGLTPYQALLTGTRNVAQYLSQLDKRGTVAVGKQADLVLLYGNPLMDIRYTREPAGVMTGGQWLDRVTLDKGLISFSARFQHPELVWPLVEIMSGMDPMLSVEQDAKLKTHYDTFKVLTDSLTVAMATGQAGARAGRTLDLRQRLAAELGAMRAILVPEQYTAFDPAVRVWLREQARQGYPVAIPGVAPMP